MWNSLIILSIAISLVFSVVLPPPAFNQLTVNFGNLGDLSTKTQGGCSGYSPTKDAFFILGGAGYDQNEAEIPKATIKNRVLKYNFGDGSTTILNDVEIPGLNRDNVYCTSQNFVSVGEKIYIVFANTIVTFNMLTETYEDTLNINFLNGNDNSEAGDEEKGQAFAACSDNEGNLFVVSQVQLYVFSIFKLEGDEPETSLIYNGGATLTQSGRLWHSCAYAKGALYVFGGRNAAKFDNVPTDKAIIDSNNIGNPTFTQTPSMRQYQVGQRAVEFGGYIYIVGGSNLVNGVFVGYTTNGVQAINGDDSTFRTVGNMNVPRLFPAICVRNGKIYAAGGYTKTGENDGTIVTKSISVSQSVNGVCENPLRNVRRLFGGGITPPGAVPDPHLRTIWGTAYDFHGDGCYYYVKTCPGVENKLPFRIRAQHFKCNAVARCMREIYIEIFDTNGDLYTEIMANASPPRDREYVNNVGEIYVGPFIRGQRVISLNTDFAIENECGPDVSILITRLNRYGLSIRTSIPKCFKCEYCGLFGYFGELKQYEFIRGDAQGTLAPNEGFYKNNFGYSWKFGPDCELPPDPTPDNGENDDLIPPVCDNNEELKDQIRAKCEEIRDEKAECCEGFDECDNVLTDCINDACAILTEEPELGVDKAARANGEVNLDVTCQIKEGGIPDIIEGVPDSESVSPTKSTPAPVGSTPSPVLSTPSPVESTPSPVESTPSPVLSTPSPVKQVITLSPTKITPAPVPAIDIEICDNPLRIAPIDPPRRLFGHFITGPWDNGAYGAGDPHIRNFYNTYFDYQGKGCYYYITQCPGKPAGTIPFNVRVQHRQCNSIARCIENVYIDLIDNEGNVVEIIDTKNDLIKDADEIYHFDNVGSISIGRWVGNTRSFQLDTPFSNEKQCGPALKIKITSYKVNGVTFLNYYADPPRCFVCESCGILGYINPDENKQLLNIHGILENDLQLFSASWRYAEECVCERDDTPYIPTPTPPPICDDDPQLNDEVNEKCENKVNGDEFLEECCEKNEELCNENIDNCKKDVCAFLSDNINTPLDDVVDLFNDANLRDVCEHATPSPPPTKSPVKSPTQSPIISPTTSPQLPPTKSPIPQPEPEIGDPTKSPTSKTNAPTVSTTKSPTKYPTSKTPAPTPANVVDVECISVFGDEVIATSQNNVVTSEAKCPDVDPENPEIVYKLVSCGTFGSTLSPAGTIITNGDTCTAINVFENQLDRVQAVARCCPFPIDSDIEIIKKNGNSRELSITECIEPNVMVGCGVSSTSNNVVGNYYGDGNGPVESDGLVSTNNQCNAEGYEDTCATSNVQCAKYNTVLYDLNCESETKLTNEALTCPNGYFMTGCNGLTEDQVINDDNSTPLDNYYISPNNECRAQQDNLRVLYTSVICCQLSVNVEAAKMMHKYSNNNDIKNNVPISIPNAIFLKRNTIVVVLFTVIAILVTVICLLTFSTKKGSLFDFKKGYSRVNPSDSTYSSGDSTN